MRRVFSLFSSVDSKLYILVKKGDFPSLPESLNVVGKQLSKREGVDAFFAYLYKQETFEGYSWRELLSISQFSGSDGAIVCEGLGELFPFFSRMSIEIPGLFIKSNFNCNSATFFGGSFYPWHEGHTECLRKCPASNIIIVPDRNPWKAEMDIDCFFQSFMSLAKKFEETSYSIFPGFYGREESNPTVDWLPRTIFCKKSLLIGDDNFCSLHRWKGADELISNLEKIYVLNRQHTQSEIDLTLQEILAINKDIEISLLGEHDYMALSSTELRAKK